MDHENEPAWIRDNRTAGVGFDPKLDEKPHHEWIGEICAGEKSYCEQCGAEFPLWPTKGWADHLLTEHSDNLTIQARTGTSLMCSDELNDAQVNFFAMMFASRVGMRRRAWKLGYAAVKDGPRIVRPAN
jgi:hypothetical protein